MLEFLEKLAAFIWNPLFSFIYLEIGILMLFLTGFVVWRQMIPQLRQMWRQKTADNVDHHLQVTPRKAFLAAVAGSIGVGNLAGVSTAIHLGGPGAIFWMWVSALLGMSFKLTSTWFAQKYQSDNPEDKAYATPMAYLQHFFKGQQSWIPVTVAVIILVTSFLTANLIQSNSLAHAIENEIDSSHLLVGLSMAALVGFVILGGIKKIVTFSSLLMPWMVISYILAGIYILLADPLITLSSLQMIIKHAFSPYSVAGGVIGYTVLQAIQFGISRGVFSHASGMGLAPFLHAANNDYPKSSAYLAALVPVADTLIVCTITALVVLNQGFWQDFNGAYLTTTSFQHFYGDFGRWFIIVCLVFFSLTTIINCSYFAEKCFRYLGGTDIYKFRWVFIFITFIGPFFPVEMVWYLGDILIAALLFIHLLALLYLVIKHREQIIEELSH